jgi:hypothetical protein
VGAAAKSDVQTARAPETGELGLVFVFAFFSRTRRPGMLGAAHSNLLYLYHQTKTQWIQQTYLHAC